MQNESGHLPEFCYPILLLTHTAKRQTETTTSASSSRSWGSLGHVSTVEGVYESGGGVHSRNRDRQVTRAGHERTLRRAGVCARAGG